MGAAVFKAEFARDLSQLAAVRVSIASWLDHAVITREMRDDILLATHEAVANAMEHALKDGPIRLRGEIAKDAVTVSVSNAGDWRPPNANDFRGRGLTVIRALMTDVDVGAGSPVSLVMRRSLRSQN
jgi:anti-sigma regulatory factor (Ser/Thr protein kinase)